MQSIAMQRLQGSCMSQHGVQSGLLVTREIDFVAKALCLGDVCNDQSLWQGIDSAIHSNIPCRHWSGLEALVMTPNGVTFLFLFLPSCSLSCLDDGL